MRTIRYGLIAALAVLSGCMGGHGEYAPAESGLEEVPAGTEPLEPLHDSEEWETAPAGCEGRLAPDLRWRLASALHGLVAAVDEDGRIICVDTVEAVEDELEDQGESERAAALHDQFMLAAGLAAPSDIRSWVMGDPTPHPSVNATLPASSGFAAGDPSPHPSTLP